MYHSASVDSALCSIGSISLQELDCVTFCSVESPESHRHKGEEALATILTAEETNIRAADGGSVFRFTFDVRPQMGESVKAEMQAAIADASRYKYTVGKQVYVHYDPYGDKKQVAMDRAA